MDGYPVQLAVNPEMPDNECRAAADEHLQTAVYATLRGLAQRYLRRSGGDALLQPTALVHEAWMRLAGGQGAACESRTHFQAVAALAMRQVLIDHLRAGGRRKRGGGWERITLSGLNAETGLGEVDLLALDEALAALAALDERAARVVALRFFGGLTEAEIASELGVSQRTVRGDWRMARAWLRCALDGRRPED